MKLLVVNAIFVTFLIACLGCSRLNTAYPIGFNKAKFHSLKIGSNEAEVKHSIGAPFTIFSHVLYSDGSTNNVIGANGDPRYPHQILFHAFYYSYPINPKSDYEVYQVIIEKGRVREIKSYVTD